ASYPHRLADRGIGDFLNIYSIFSSHFVHSPLSSVTSDHSSIFPLQVHYKFELMEETLFLTVNIIDRFLARQTVVRKKLQLAGVTAMLLACKYEEVSVPVVEDLILISDRAYTREEVLEMVILSYFPLPVGIQTQLELLSFFIIELCLVEYKMLKFRPSLLAAAAIYTAQCSLRGLKYWTKTSELHSNYSEDQLL
ncbi:hypothetical protein GW17_00056361, partial [Ensete ventricosum]